MAARYSVSLHLSEAEYQAFASAAADAGLSIYSAAQAAIREWTALHTRQKPVPAHIQRHLAHKKGETQP